MSWGLQCNVALFTAVFTLQSLPVGNHGAVITPILKLWGIGGISAFGLMASLLSSVGVRAAHRQTVSRDTDSDWKQTEFIRPFGIWGVHKAARKISVILPLAFSVLWLLIMLWAYKQG